MYDVLELDIRVKVISSNTVPYGKIVILFSVKATISSFLGEKHTHTNHINLR